MKLRIYLLRMAVGAAAFFFGIGIFGAILSLSSLYNTAKPKIAATKTEKPVGTGTADATKPAADFARQIEPPAESVVSTNSEFDASGEYLSIDELPKEFKDFAVLNITARDYENTTDEFPNGIPIPPEGFVYTTRKHKFTRISLGDRQLAFETEAKKGISYKFSGAFLESDKWERDEELNSYVVLKGTLTKMRDGKKIAKIKIRFTFDESCSC
jgi:hypothetical protein